MREFEDFPRLSTAKVIGRNAIVFVAAVLVGALLLVLAFLLPTAPMREHVESEIDVLEDNYSMQPYPDRPNAEIDHMMDYHMLAMAVNQSSENVFKQAMGCYYKLPEGSVDQIGILKETVSPREGAPEAPYARYWHGYLAPLKIELLFADYYSITLYNGVALLALLAYVVVLMVRRGVDRYIPALLLAFGLVSPVSVSMSMSYYPCAYVVLIALAVLLKCDRRLEEKQLIGTTFMLAGMATSYLDFLTAPIVTLGFPLAMYAILLNERDGLAWKKLIFLPIYWGVGYVGMWAAKWLVGMTVLQQDVIAEALGQITTRTSTHVGNAAGALETDSLTYADVIGRNLNTLAGPISSKAILVVYALASVGVVLVQLRRGRGTKSTKAALALVLVLLVASLLPFAWSRALENHTYMHAYFTFRIFSLTVFALASIPFAFVQGASREVEDEPRGNPARERESGPRAGRHFSS